MQKKEPNPYDDIIDLPHHVSKVHPQMSPHARAAQFSAFAALTGFGEVIEETARRTTPKRELDESEKAELNRKLAFLAERLRLREKPAVRIEYFVPDERKDGGAYAVKSAVVVRLSRDKKTLTLDDGTAIPFENIAGIEELVQ